MKKIFFPAVMLLLACCLAATGYSFEQYPKLISYENLKEWLDSGKDFIMVDTLSPLEYAAGTIPGSINIPMSDFEKKGPEIIADKDKTIVFFCKGLKCHKSHTTAFKAEKMGYKNIWVYAEGTPNWVMHGNKLVGEYYDRFPAFVNPPELKELLEKNLVFLVDVQDPEGYKQAHIKGAVSIPLYVLHERFSEIPKDANVVFADKAGKQIVVPAQFLMSKGYNSARCLSGGVQNWSSAGFALETEE